MSRKKTPKDEVFDDEIIGGIWCPACQRKVNIVDGLCRECGRWLGW